MKDLSGKVIIVTGAAGGIGREACLGLARENASVLAVDIDENGVKETTNQLTSLGGRGAYLKVDVTSESDTAMMAEEAVKRFSGIDVLINIAAYFSGVKKRAFNEISSDEWDKVMRVNVKGTWLCSKAVFNHMQRNRRGKIINMASSTFYSGATGFPHYVASKGALIGLTRALAMELGQYNITVNAIAPGYTETKTSHSIDPPEFSDRLAASRALKRKEYPTDLDGTLVFLCSDTSDFITGQTLVVDGGSTLS